MRVLVTGATGLIGKRLVKALLARGDTVLPVYRRALPHELFDSPPAGQLEPLLGDVCQSGPWLDALTRCDGVVHLAGEPIMGRRWSSSVLRSLRDSRIKSTELIAKALARHSQSADSRAKVFVSGSAIGYYGADTGERILTETDQPGGDQMSQMCVEWELAALPAATAGVRVCHPRTGIVLDAEGGALPQMALPFRLFIGGRIGSGKQYVSWIHHEDMTRILLFALDRTDIVGPFNAVSPNPVTNSDFSTILARVLRRPNWLPVPRTALRILLGQVAQVVAGGQRVHPKAIIEHGFEFKYSELEPALKNLLGSHGPCS